ncbi:conserved hypothetical protein [Pediculus humanus corporis]|uniref:Uncharacterized protein n=1 Tax=Pediculus humanus subsp. corporis TaxID=121224 RepID=E0W145_PEDHC|nr:uncharacterized protein Phum_PHUM569530 [Pediculus humanus corporis]EEB19351.1 conserved hypothetical protein [Pediculus humanus corporis]
MNHGRKTPTHSMGTGSMYSHVTKSTSNLKSTKSVHSLKSLKVPWYKKPIITNGFIFDVQRASLYIGFYAIALSIFTLITSMFDLYCYSVAVPGSIHYGYYLFSFDFVYVGNKHVRNALIVFALFSLVASVAVFITAIILIVGLRKEYERKMVPFLYVFAFFTLFRIFAFIFFCIVNDLIFSYNALMCFCWAIFSAINLYGWILIYSLYLELEDLTKLEDLAHLRMGTMTSLNASTTHSIAGSRPTTPHSTISTAPVR